MEIIAYQNQWRLDESKPFTWGWKYSEERFERPHHEAYKITLHQSYREGGTVRKRQYSICTLSWYDIVEFGLYDCADGRIQATAEKLVSHHLRGAKKWIKTEEVKKTGLFRCKKVRSVDIWLTYRQRAGSSVPCATRL